MSFSLFCQVMANCSCKKEIGGAGLAHCPVLLSVSAGEKVHDLFFMSTSYTSIFKLLMTQIGVDLSTINT